jgi:uncharacterized protein YndB with AHSA1/START domain
MKNLMMNFSVDKENKKIVVEREFAAPLDTVWAAWTQPELLDQWWAPKPWKTKTKSMDFREGGMWLYSMVGPEGERHWCKAEYKTIRKQEKFSALDAFCDEEGNTNTDFPRAFWTNSFSSKADSTVVNIEIAYDDLSDLEKYIEMGFKEGFTMALENLDELFAA